MHRISILASLLALAASSPASADILSTADTLYKFDYASSGNVADKSEIIDSSGNGHNATSLTNNGGKLNWTTVPAVAPGGLPAVDPVARGLQFTPQVVTPGAPDVVYSGGFQAVNVGATVTGDATIVTRFYWDGYISDDGDGQMFWLINDHLSFGGAGTGWMFGVRDTGRFLTFYRNGGGYGQIVSNLALTPGKWYDVAAVLHDTPGGDVNNGSDWMKFYLLPEDGTLSTYTVATPVNSFYSAASTTLTIGSESLGQGSSNQRKGFQGTIDYLALWDTELADHQIIGLLQVPEPSTVAMLLGLVGIGLLGYLRRRR